MVKVKSTALSSDFEQRYDAVWPQLSQLAKQLTGYLCCFPGCQNEATETHHVCYWALKPEPGKTLFPLCDRHHKERTDPECAHHWRNWHKGTGLPPRRNAGQKPHYYRKLVEGWQEKRDRQKAQLQP